MNAMMSHQGFLLSLIEFCDRGLSCSSFAIAFLTAIGRILTMPQLVLFCHCRKQMHLNSEMCSINDCAPETLRQACMQEINLTIACHDKYRYSLQQSCCWREIDHLFCRPKLFYSWEQTYSWARCSTCPCTAVGRRPAFSLPSFRLQKPTQGQHRSICASSPSSLPQNHFPCCQLSAKDVILSMEEVQGHRMTDHSGTGTTLAQI